jgi:TRAP-type C4-dicarboxylate transport system permease small subunit
MNFFYRPEQPEPVVLRWLGDGVDIVLTVLAALLLIVMIANVAARVALNSDIAWNTEFGEFVLLWATFLGGASAARRGGHMRIGEFVDGFPPRIGRVVEFATRIGVIGLLMLLVWYGATISLRTWEQEMTMLHWSIGVHYLSMPVGSGVALIFVVYETVLLALRRPLPQEAFQD